MQTKNKETLNFQKLVKSFYSNIEKLKKDKFKREIFIIEFSRYEKYGFSSAKKLKNELMINKLD